MFPAPYPYLLLLVPAAVLARDDFRTRRVDASWLAVLGTVSVGVSWHTLGWRTMLLQTAGNAALLLLSGTALFGYLRLRRLAVRHSVGFGDALFLLAVAPLFAPTEFLWFLIAACVVASSGGSAAAVVVVRSPSSVQPALCSSAGPLFNSSAYGCNPDTYPHGDPPPAHGAGGRRVPPRAIRTRGGQDTLLRRDGT